MSKKIKYTASDHIVAVLMVVLLILVILLVPLVWGGLWSSVPLVFEDLSIFKHPLHLFFLFWQPVVYTYIIWTLSSFLLGEFSYAAVVEYGIAVISFSILNISKYPSHLIENITFISLVVIASMIFSLRFLKFEVLYTKLVGLNNRKNNS